VRVNVTAAWQILSAFGRAALARGLERSRVVRCLKAVRNRARGRISGRQATDIPTAGAIPDRRLLSER